MWFHRPDTEGAALAVLDLDGEGETRVYLGGLGSASTVAFAPVVAHPLLAGRHRSLVVDLVGTGWSEHDDSGAWSIERHADSIASVVVASGEGPAHLVGHSLGGSVAISVACRHPHLVSRLTVCEPNLDPGVGTFSATIAAWDEDAFVAQGHREVVADLLTHAEAGDSNAAEFARTTARWSPRALHQTAVSLLAARTPTFREQLLAVTVPRLMVMGEETATDEPDLVASGCPLTVVPRAGHVMMADNLDAFCAAIS